MPWCGWLSAASEAGAGAECRRRTADGLENDGILACTNDAAGHLLRAAGTGRTVAFDWDAEARLATTTLDGTATSCGSNGATPVEDWTKAAFATGQTQARRHVFGTGG